MRDIKFRAKRIDNGQFMYGDILQGKVYIAMVESVSIYEGNKGILAWVKVDPSTICQFTGMYDNHDNEIYEGDLLRFTVFDHTGADKQHTGRVGYKGSRFVIFIDSDTEDTEYQDDEILDIDWVIEQDETVEITGNCH